jgi:hypothetical protein
MTLIVDVVNSSTAEAMTGLVTGVAAGTASAGHLLAMRNPGALAVRLRYLDVSCTTLTAFTAAQEVGFDVFKATAYTAAHTGGAGVVPSKAFTDQAASLVTSTQLRVATTGALTNGTDTLDTDRILTDSFWCAGLTSLLAWRQYNWSSEPAGGLLLKANEGIVLRNTILMGAAGVVRWSFRLGWDDVIVTGA